jgi:hypothetical protein
MTSNYFSLFVEIFIASFHFPAASGTDRDCTFPLRINGHDRLDLLLLPCQMVFHLFLGHQLLLLICPFPLSLSLSLYLLQHLLPILTELFSRRIALRCNL